MGPILWFLKTYLSFWSIFRSYSLCRFHLRYFLTLRKNCCCVILKNLFLYPVRQSICQFSIISYFFCYLTPIDRLSLFVWICVNPTSMGGGKIGHVSLQAQLSKKIHLDTTFNTFENLIYHLIIISLWVYMRELCIYSCREKKVTNRPQR